MPNKTLFIGHSLVGTTMPQMLNGLLAARGHADYQVINGAPLSYQWTHGATAQGVNARAVLPSGSYNTLILTEAVPLAGHIKWDNTYGYARSYAQLAVAANPATRVMVYETWGEITNEATWRAHLTSDRTVWQGIANNLNANRATGQPTVHVVPGGQAMARLYDTIAQHEGAGLTSIRQIFIDQIHLNDAGSYLIAVLQYAAINKTSPIGVTDQLKNQWGQAYSGWTSQQSNLFQHVAWEAVALAPGNDLALGALAPRLLHGTATNNSLLGGDGDDRLYGRAGNDHLSGGKGQDLLAGGLGSDRIDGGAGNDWLHAGGGNDHLLGGSGNDRLFGTAGRDTLDGGTGDDLLTAAGGNDHLSGWAGADRLYGGGGNDVLKGGKGADSLWGGAGADSFVFAHGNGADHIGDFRATDGDHLILSHRLWTGTLTAAQLVQRFADDTPNGIVFDFGNGDRFTLDGVHSLNGLASQLDII